MKPTTPDQGISDIAAMLASTASQQRPQWHAPIVAVFPIIDTAGDPTISDDGLGDGLFS